MRWIVRVARTMDDVKECHFTDKDKALNHVEALKTELERFRAHQLDLDVTECLGIAYEEIKNRKGKMVNGTFVKEEDL